MEKYVIKLYGKPLRIAPEEFARRLFTDIAANLTLEPLTEAEELDSTPIETHGKRLIQKLTIDAMLEEQATSGDSMDYWLKRFQAGFDPQRYRIEPIPYNRLQAKRRQFQ